MELRHGRRLLGGQSDPQKDVQQDGKATGYQRKQEGEHTHQAWRQIEIACQSGTDATKNLVAAVGLDALSVSGDQKNSHENEKQNFTQDTTIEIDLV